MNYEQYFDETIFEQYLNNTLPMKEKTAFETALYKDATLKDALEAYKAMKEDLETIRTYRQIQKVAKEFEQTERAQQSPMAMMMESTVKMDMAERRSTMKPIRTILAIAASLLIAVGIWSLITKDDTIDIATLNTTLSDTRQGLIPSTWQLATQAIEKSDFIKADSLLSIINLNDYDDDIIAQQKIQLLWASVKIQLKQCEEARLILLHINDVTETELKETKESLLTLLKKC